MSNPRLSDNPMLRAKACQDCPADIGLGHEAGVLVVVVSHSATCPWARRHFPAGASRVGVPGGGWRIDTIES
jgi:hypothetical protein